MRNVLKYTAFNSLFYFTTKTFRVFLKRGICFMEGKKYIIYPSSILKCLPNVFRKDIIFSRHLATGFYF